MRMRLKIFVNVLFLTGLKESRKKERRCRSWRRETKWRIHACARKTGKAKKKTSRTYTHRKKEREIKKVFNGNNSDK